ncbi:hypothetical protein A3A54_01045 [Candidatus Curtissbacteria bacterium RIFCSPLOWO2_01_FULL_39_62]|uniref:Type II toxin-antitoxin system RelE/ParE family toxin n=1 Tax=Candidatus Curtissbacteria bacterium RIFCSPHIGHO2_02_FULL_40_16b TaxID=1797714 RepID=A0A1F5GAK7_9BACT|nr:MAG: hypothetical protein A3D04_03745 [Candidatus Curtissbacteria bacterium RIFCSPHIGHO2_02_FULL_40_16b]OGD91038.1 MAG: hypothetical protein A3E11_00175 [Candidatus Curtissbacteria bacterium RIFCSPHIGHO2_12_FULL_38_37]OGD99372.1 MAG: hypothetical protein A3J17_02375 [Candidatus Curtissbacteria bacterium RIFCSPLOWO2_02_FULL_40_11]OGE01402.1 MAG: hypothetical protein A3A54_01045 [Candidatus Curtissbacteria bacterium RIFCSPLOWO2_01_FULL_39_62]
MYDIVANSSRSVEKDFDTLINSLTVKESKKLLNTLSKFPKARPNINVDPELYGLVKKKKRFWQYYVQPTGQRVIYVVVDKADKKVIIRFAGTHDEAQAFLRNNN